VRSYHGQPVIKEPIWTWEIPCYFFTGGLAGASAGLAYLAGIRGNDELERRAWAAATAGIAISPAFLTSDLGKPLRFLNMLRMFKVTSPMSVGSWILVGSGATTTMAAANAWTGLFPRSARLARPAAALLGLPLSTYTAALIANTAVPVWHEARRMLPFVFGSGAALSAGAAAVMSTAPEHAAPARRLAVACAALELGLNVVMKKQLGEHGEPYKRGTPSKFSHLSQALILGGVGALLGRGASSRAAAAAGGGLMCAGALSARWTVFKAGFQSAADPKYVVGPQRAMIDRGERAGASRRTSKVQEVKPERGSPATAPVELSAP
jgi:formate-dependent nitrite reductase membrane component NrfD